MSDFEDTFSSIEDDAKNLISGDIEIAGKKIPKVAIIGVAGLGIAAIVIINRNRVSGVITNTSNSGGLSSPIGNTNPSATNDNNSDAGSFSPLGNLESVLSNIPGLESTATPISDFEGSLPAVFSNGDLGSFISSVPDISAYTNPALDMLPDLSAYGLAIPQAAIPSFTGVSEPYSNMPTNKVIAAQKEASQPKVTKPVSKLAQNLLNGFNSPPKPTNSPIKKSTGNAVIKPGTTINLFGGSQPSVKQPSQGNAIVKSILNNNVFGFGVAPNKQVTTTKPVNSGNAVITNPIKTFTNLFGGSAPKPVTPVTPYKAPVITPVTNPITNFFLPKPPPSQSKPVVSNSGSGRTTIRSVFQW